MAGRKIKWEYENPVDNILIYINERLNPLYKALYFTPNTLTTLSLIITLVGLYLYTQNYLILGSLLYFLGYYFDCADGNYARTYKMQSNFGDYYDHISDGIKFLVLLYVIYKTNVKYDTKLFVYLILTIFLILIQVHLGCQEKIYNKTNESKSINMLKRLCSNTDHIKYIRFFGCGTLSVITVLILIYIKAIDKYIF